MSEKRVKAWAVVNKRGDIAWASDGLAAIFRDESAAINDLDPECFPGERVAPVEIIIKEAK